MEQIKRNTLDLVKRVYARARVSALYSCACACACESYPLLGDTLEDLFLILVQTHGEGGVVPSGDMYLVHLHLRDAQLLQG